MESVVIQHAATDCSGAEVGWGERVEVGGQVGRGEAEVLGGATHAVCVVVEVAGLAVLDADSFYEHGGSIG